MNLTARERRILKMAREWAKLTPHNYYSNKINAEVLYGAGTARKNCGKRLLKLFPKAALKLK